MQCPVDDQAVAKFLFDFGEWRWTPIPHLVWCRVCEDEESRLVRSACELPHGPLEQVAEAPDAVLLVRTCSVVWFVVDEFTRGSLAGQVDHVNTAGPSASISSERRTTSGESIGVAIHV